MDAVVQQSIDKNIERIRDIDSYFIIRRGIIGIGPSLAIYGLYLNIPDSVINHPVIVKLTEFCTDMIIMDNDMISYKDE